MVNSANLTSEWWVEKTDVKYDKGTFLRHFVKKRFKDKRNKVDFINEVMDTSLNDNDNIPSWILTYLENFAVLNPWYKIDKSKLGEFKVKDLRSMIMSEVISLDKNRANIKALFLKEYEITSKDYDKKLKQKIDNLSEEELNSLNDINKRSKFIEDAFSSIDWKKNTPKRRDFLVFINKLGLSGKIKEKLKTVTWEEKTRLELLINNFQNLKIDEHDISELFSMNLLSEDEKREILYTFMPSISLLQAKTLWLIDDKKSLEIREEVLREYFSWQKSIDYGLLWRSLDEDALMVDTKSLTSSSSDFKRLYSQLSLKPISDALTQVVSETRKEIISSWAKSFVQFKEAIKWDERLNKMINWGLEKLQSWNVLRLKIHEKSWETKYVFSKIGSVDIWEDKNQMQLYESWEGNTYFKWSKSSSNYDYPRFLESLKKEESLLWIEVFSEKELQDSDEFRVEDVSWELNLKSEDELEEYKEYLMWRIADKKKEFIDEWKYEVWDLRSEEIDNEPDIIKLTNELDSLDLYNKNALIRAIDWIDEKWKHFWLDKWTVFGFVQDWKVWWKFQENVWTIESVTDDKVNIKWIKGDESIDFRAFYQSFKWWDAKRIEKINSTSELLNKVWWIWDREGFEINSKWELIRKRKESDVLNLPVEYLEGKESDNFIKIYNIWEDWAEVSFWEIETRTKKDKDWKNIKDKEWNSEKSTERKLYKRQKISLWILYSYIKDNKLSPVNRWEQRKTDEIKRHNSWWSKLFKASSIQELMKAWKIVTDSLEKFLWEWRDDHAATLAKWIFWSFLPHELKMDLKARVQEEQEKSGEASMNKLKRLDSDEATRLIEKWLLNKDCPQYKLEAGLLFMYKEYWHLYAKDLAKYSWSFLWYRALWWIPHDPLYNEIKSSSRAKIQWANFTEEELVYNLVKRQCRESQYKEYGWILRASRVHKQLKAMWPEWIQNEIAKWFKDAEDTRSVVWMNEWFYWELIWWTLANSTWWIKKIWERWWWEIHDTYEALTCLFVTWAIYQMDQRNLSKEVKNWHKWSDGRPLIFLEFISTPQDMDLFNETFLEVCKSLEEIYPEKSGIWEKAKYFFDNKEIWWLFDEKNSQLQKRAKEFQDFWKDHGELITRTLLMLNWWKWEYSKTDKLLLLEKDKPWKESFWKYMDKVRSVCSNGFNFKNEYFKEDYARWAGLSWLSTYDAVTQSMRVGSSYIFNDAPLAIDFWNEIRKEAKRVVNGDFDYEKKKKQLIPLFRDVLAWLYEVNSNNNLAHIFNKKWHILSWMIGELWLYDFYQWPYKEVDKLDISGDSINDSNKALINKKIDSLVDNYIRTNWHVEENQGWPLSQYIRDNVSNKASNVIEWNFWKKQNTNSVNDDNYDLSKAA